MGSQVLSALAGTDWGWSSDLLTRGYNVSILSSATYAAAAWQPWLSGSGYSALDRGQNRCLRSITGMHKSTPVEALRLEVGAESFRTTAKRSAAVAYEKAMRLPALSHPTSRIARYPARRRLRRGTDWRSMSVGVASHVWLNAFQRLDLPPPTALPWEKGKESWSISLTLKGGSGKDPPAEVLLAD